MTRNDTNIGFYHDPLGRLDDIMGGSLGFQYDGDISTQVLDASPFTIQRYLVADERGSVIAVADSSGNPTQINSYDEYGPFAQTSGPRMLQYRTCGGHRR